jgi:hypothetical protein
MDGCMGKNFARYAFALALLAGIGLTSIQGCSSGQETQTTVTSTYPPTPDDPDASNPPNQPYTTTTTTTTSRPDSVLGATAHAVWTVVALPFRLVGDALGLIL